MLILSYCDTVSPQQNLVISSNLLYCFEHFFFFVTLKILSVDSQNQDTIERLALALIGTKSRTLFQEVKIDSHNPNLF